MVIPEMCFPRWDAGRFDRCRDMYYTTFQVYARWLEPYQGERLENGGKFRENQIKWKQQLRGIEESFRDREEREQTLQIVKREFALTVLYDQHALVGSWFNLADVLLGPQNRPHSQIIDEVGTLGLGALEHEGEFEKHLQDLADWVLLHNCHPPLMDVEPLQMRQPEQSGPDLAFLPDYNRPIFIVDGLTTGSVNTADYAAANHFQLHEEGYPLVQSFTDMVADAADFSRREDDQWVEEYWIEYPPPPEAEFN